MTGHSLSPRTTPITNLKESFEQISKPNKALDNPLPRREPEIELNENPLP